MYQTELVQKINDVMHRGFELPMEKLQPEATLFQDLGLDSLDAIDMLVHLEETLGVKVETERFQNVRTLGDVYTMVGELAKESPHEPGNGKA